LKGDQSKQKSRDHVGLPIMSGKTSQI
jgi:hypothetical protein